MIRLFFSAIAAFVGFCLFQEPFLSLESLETTRLVLGMLGAVSLMNLVLKILW